MSLYRPTDTKVNLRHIVLHTYSLPILRSGSSIDIRAGDNSQIFIENEKEIVGGQFHNSAAGS